MPIVTTVAATFVILVFIGIYRRVKRGESFAEMAIKLGKYHLDEEQKALLEELVPYYKGLPPKKKLRFEQRVAFFGHIKEFHGEQDLEISKTMITLISAMAVKITFAFKEFTLPHFHHIHVYPAEYYSNDTKHYHKGEIHLDGKIKLSWLHFTEGIATHNDGLNLAVHEFSHAVYFENQIANKHYYFISWKKLRRWRILAKQEMRRMQENNEHFIRKYGATNLKEFFAVCSEHFFEQPFEYHQKHPELFKAMVHIYRQDPRRYLKTHS